MTEYPPAGEASNVRVALAQATARLVAISDTPRLDAELLMAHALGTTRDALLLNGLDRSVPDGFAVLLDRRLAHEPVAYILGTRDFWTITLEVGPGVLVPRPDSETLIEAAVEHFAERAPKTILDLGTGPGTLLLAALAHWPEAEGVGVDASERALEFAKRNAERIAPGRARMVRGDWGTAIDDRFDLILVNPPYVETTAELPGEVARHEPPEALFAGAEGLDDYRRIVPQLPRLLAPGGAAILEIGHTQFDPVRELVEREGLIARRRCDLAGLPRAIVAT